MCNPEVRNSRRPRFCFILLTWFVARPARTPNPLLRSGVEPYLYIERADYTHDTIEVFAANLAELREVFTREIHPKLRRKQLGEEANAAEALFGSVNDTVREAALVARGRVNAEAFIETCRSGLKAIFV